MGKGTEANFVPQYCQQVDKVVDLKCPKSQVTSYLDQHHTQHILPLLLQPVVISSSLSCDRPLRMPTLAPWHWSNSIVQYVNMWPIISLSLFSATNIVAHRVIQQRSVIDEFCPQRSVQLLLLPWQIEILNSLFAIVLIWIIPSNTKFNKSWQFHVKCSDLFIL